MTGPEPGREADETNGRSTSDAKAPGALLKELVDLVVAYAKQETIQPIKALVRFVGFGVAGAVLLSVGGGLLTLAAVRLLQAETGGHLRGSLTWVPYVGGMLVAAVGAGWAASRVTKVPR